MDADHDSSLSLLASPLVSSTTGKLFHRKPQDFLSTLIILGSGGHKAEMINVFNVFEDSAIDSVGWNKVSVAQFMKICRNRAVRQSCITSVGTTLLALAHAMWLMIHTRPQVVLCNGPGTCILCDCVPIQGEYSKSEEAVVKWFAAIQIATASETDYILHVWHGYLLKSPPDILHCDVCSFKV